MTGWVGELSDGQFTALVVYLLLVALYLTAVLVGAVRCLVREEL